MTAVCVCYPNTRQSPQIIQAKIPLWYTTLVSIRCPQFLQVVTVGTSPRSPEQIITWTEAHNGTQVSNTLFIDPDAEMQDHPNQEQRAATVHGAWTAFTASQHTHTHTAVLKICLHNIYPSVCDP